MSRIPTIEEFMDKRSPVESCFELEVLDALTDLRADVQYLENAVLSLASEIRGRR